MAVRTVSGVIHDTLECPEIHELAEEISDEQAVEQIDTGAGRPCGNCVGSRPPIGEGENG